MRFGNTRPAGLRVLVGLAGCAAILGGASCRAKYDAEVRAYAEEVCVDSARQQIGMKPLLMASMSQLAAQRENLQQVQAAGISLPMEAEGIEALAREAAELTALPFYAEDVDEAIAGILQTSGISEDQRNRRIADALAETPWWREGCQKELPGILQDCADAHGLKTPAFLICLDPDDIKAATTRWSPFFARYQRDFAPRARRMGLLVQ